MHQLWPDSFKETVRTFLLANNRAGGSVRSSRRKPADRPLPALPADVLTRVIELAAAPMTVWSQLPFMLRMRANQDHANRNRA